MNIRSCDDRILTISMEAAKLSTVLKEAFSMFPDERNCEDIPIPLSSCILKRVIAWCEEHKNDPKPEKEKWEAFNRRTDDMSAFDVDFLTLPKQDLADLINKLGNNLLSRFPLLILFPCLQEAVV
ncbi:S-phase kinase-associated protein 1-like [Watersipora subatra]|uniref:S-phase kinase-associated protein 1-like n=1 Tax=Watersipora subatra TaxID=2589382 RepID=UPI00355B6A7E